MSKQVIAIIDISTPSGRRILSELQGKEGVRLEYPQGEHSVETQYVASLLKEPLVEYESSKTKTIDALPQGYISLEEFRIEAKKRARKTLSDHGIHP